jgi:hypothetical protein
VAASSESTNDPRVAELRRENAELRAELHRVRESRSFRLGHAVMRAASTVVPGKRAGAGPGDRASDGPGHAVGSGRGGGATSTRAPAGHGGAAGGSPSMTTAAGAAPGAAAGGAAGGGTATAGRSASPLDEVAPLAVDLVGPRTPDDLLVDASRVPAELLGDAVAGWRRQLPAHARLLVVHGDAKRVAGGADAPDGVGAQLDADDGDGARVVAVSKDIDLDAAKARFGSPRTVRASKDGSIPPLEEPKPRSPMVSPVFGEQLPTEGLPPAPIFVGGTGRSGTWVIGRMLRHHPHWITVHTELRFHSVPSGFVSVLDGSVSPERYAEKVENKWFRISGGSGNAKGLQIIVARHELQKALRKFLKRAESDVPRALGDLLLDIIEPYARGRGAVGWTETTPYNAHAAHALLTALPQSRLVHTVRDGRDVASSVTSMPWGPDTIEEGLDWWASRVLQASQGVAAADPHRVLTVRLEELIHLEREASYARILEFLGFEDHEEVRRYFDEQIDSKRGNVGRWRKQVEKSERDRIDGRYRELLDELSARGMNVLPTEPERVDELAGR